MILIKLQPIKGSVWVRFAFLSVIHPPGNCLYGHRKNRHFFYTNDKIGLIFAPAYKNTPTHLALDSSEQIVFQTGNLQQL